MEEIFIPASGMAAEDVLVSEWLKEPGDQVAIGEPVAVVETDKATVELSGTTAGRLSRHLVEAGARVPGGTTVAYLLEDGESEPGNGGGPPPPVTAPLASSSLPDAEDEVRGQGVPEPIPPPEARRSDGRHTLSPRQRRALAEPAPSGASSTADPGVAAVAKGPSTAEPQSTNRQATAALVTESWRSVPHFSVGRRAARRRAGRGRICHEGGWHDRYRYRFPRPGSGQSYKRVGRGTRRRPGSGHGVGSADPGPEIGGWLVLS